MAPDGRDASQGRAAPAGAGQGTDRGAAAARRQGRDRLGRGLGHRRAREPSGSRRATSRAPSTSPRARAPARPTPMSTPTSIAEAAGGRDKRVILVCGQGNRSARTADALHNEHGFERVASVIGGVKLWDDLGYPVEGEIVVGADDVELEGSMEGDTTEAGTPKIEHIKKKIEQLSPEQAQKEIEAGGDAVLIDTRDATSTRGPPRGRRSWFPRTRSPSGHRAEVAPDTSRRVILYCAPATARPARRTARRSSATRTPPPSPAASRSGEAQGLPVVVPEGMSSEQRERYSRHTLLPEVGVEGQIEASEREGAAAGRRRAGLADRPLPRRGRDRHDRDRRRRPR